MNILAGRFKGQKIRTIAKASYRPTTSRVRKSIFDMLGDLDEYSVLDLFAGSGILGFEAASRGATAITFVPLVLTLCTSMNWDPYPFMLAVAIAASASFATPIGYQTNTLVFSLGQYKFKDFIKIGIPMTLITGAAACWTIIYYYL